jgi:hypothetical protein
MFLRDILWLPKITNPKSQISNKSQIPNIKRFDRLTALSRVEGQIPMSKTPNPNLLVFGSLELGI